MRRFFKKFILFVFFAGFLAFIIFQFFDYSYRSALHQETFPEKVKTLIAGDSHTEVAVNDEILQDARNLSLSQEPLYFTYYKLEPLLTNNDAVRNLILGFSYHSLSAAYDEFIVGNMATHVVPTYFFILPGDERIKLIKNNIRSSPYLARSIYKTAVEDVFADPENMQFYGGYFNDFKLVSADTTAMKKRASRHFYRGTEMHGVSEINLEYLQKIKALCQETQTNLILLNTPVHPFYKKLVPEEFIRTYYAVVEDLALDLIDLSDLPLDEDHYSPDGDHVSRLGAEVTTLKLMKEQKRRAELLSKK